MKLNRNEHRRASEIQKRSKSSTGICNIVTQELLKIVIKWSRMSRSVACHRFDDVNTDCPFHCSGTVGG